MRFTNITVPQSATITDAFVSLRARVTSSNATVRTNLEGEDIDNAPTFSDDSDFDGRVHTTASVAWDGIGAWTAGTWYDSVNVSSIIQEIVNRGGWIGGNALVIFWMDDSSDSWAMRDARSYDYSVGTSAPKLNITYTTSGGAPVGSYSRAMHIVQPVSAIFMRSYVTFEDLPDSDGTIWVLRMATEGGTWIASTGINRTGANYYWSVAETSGTRNYTQDTINADETYEIEIYFNATTNGNATVWINNTIMCEMTGDFSGAGTIQRVYPYIFIAYGAQTTRKSVYQDLFAVTS